MRFLSTQVNWDNFFGRRRGVAWICLITKVSDVTKTWWNAGGISLLAKLPTHFRRESKSKYSGATLGCFVH
jgi:hypothetical protein